MRVPLLMLVHRDKWMEMLMEWRCSYAQASNGSRQSEYGDKETNECTFFFLLVGNTRFLVAPTDRDNATSR